MAVVLLQTTGAPAATAGDEFLCLWNLHRQAALASNHLAAAEACREAARPAGANGETRLGRYLPAARTIEAWHLLQAGRATEATTAYEAALADGTPAAPLRAAADALARRWLSRLDREQVVASLAAYYREHVAFPPDLAVFAAWPSAKRPPPLDRRGDAWIYQLQAFRRLKLDGAQRYRLYSRSVGRETSALADALALLPPATPIVFVRKGATVPALAEFRIGGATNRPVIAQEGTRAGGLVFAALDGAGRFALLSDDDFWLLALPPEGGRR